MSLTMSCLFCHRPYDDADVHPVGSAIVYYCRNCGSERIVSVPAIDAVYGPDAARNGRRGLVDQARRLEG